MTFESPSPQRLPFDPDQHTCRVDIIDLEVRDLGDAQARAIGDTERRFVFDARCCLDRVWV